MNKILLFYSAVISGILMAACNIPQQLHKDPNIIILLMEDAGYHDFRFNGGLRPATPVIDSLAARGTVMTGATVTATEDGPSRSAILCGRYQERFGCETSDDGDAQFKKETPLAAVLGKKGYSSAYIGRWHLKHMTPQECGFGHFYGYSSEEKYSCPESGSGFGNGELSTHASGYIQNRKKGDSPFLLFVSYNRISPATPSGKIDTTTEARKKEAVEYSVLDKGIGKILQELEKAGAVRNTLIFFLSDNGSLYRCGYGNEEMKGFKGNTYEGGIRIPFFITYGDRFKGQFEGAVSSLDVFATAIAAAGIEESSLKKSIDGENLLPYLKGVEKGDPHKFLYWRNGDVSAIRMGDYKMIRIAGGDHRLYNLKYDSKEKEDISTVRPGILSLMMAQFQRWELEMPLPPPSGDSPRHEVDLAVTGQLMENRKPTCFTTEDLVRLKKQRNRLFRNQSVPK